MHTHSHLYRCLWTKHFGEAKWGRYKRGIREAQPLLHRPHLASPEIFLFPGPWPRLLLLLLIMIIIIIVPSHCHKNNTNNSNSNNNDTLDVRGFHQGIIPEIFLFPGPWPSNPAAKTSFRPLIRCSESLSSWGSSSPEVFALYPDLQKLLQRIFFGYAYASSPEDLLLRICKNFVPAPDSVLWKPVFQRIFFIYTHMCIYIYIYT